MTSHCFIFSPGEWLGEGKIHFAESPEEMRFYTRWFVSQKESGVISCLQEIEVEGVPDPMCNSFYFSEVDGDSFAVRLDNNVLGVVDGEGVVDDKVLSWELRQGKNGFEGFEIYTACGEEYRMHGEYAADQMRTLIDGKIWLRS